MWPSLDWVMPPPFNILSLGFITFLARNSRNFSTNLSGTQYVFNSPISGRLVQGSIRNFRTYPLPSSLMERSHLCFPVWVSKCLPFPDPKLGMTPNIWKNVRSQMPKQYIWIFILCKGIIQYWEDYCVIYDVFFVPAPFISTNKHKIKGQIPREIIIIVGLLQNGCRPEYLICEYNNV